MKPANVFHQVRHKMAKSSWARTTKLGDEVRVVSPRTLGVTVFKADGSTAIVTLEAGSHFDNLPTTTDTIEITANDKKYRMVEGYADDYGQRLTAYVERSPGTDSWESVRDVEL